MTISIASPNVDNYSIGKAKIYFQRTGQSGAILDHEIGNCTEAEFTPTVETLDHFSSREGVRKKDKSVALETSAQIRLVMEEFTPENLGRMLMGIPNVSDPANVTIDILSEAEIDGHLRIVGTNDVGPKWTFDFPTVSFKPSSSMNPISDEWNNMEITGEVLASGSPESFGTASADFSDNVAPANTALPSIAGIAQVGQTLTANNGSWSGNPASFTYKWQKAAVDIPGAIASTYVPVVGDVGAALTVIVSAVNATGTTPATSGATANVIA
jgi:hypothetical protein